MTLPSTWGRQFSLIAPENALAFTDRSQPGAFVWSETNMGQVVSLTMSARLQRENIVPPFVAIPSAVDIWAEVSWGSGGGRHSAQVDVGAGTTLLLAAEQIEVVPHYTAWMGMGAVDPVPVLFDVSVVRGALPCLFCPTRTVRTRVGAIIPPAPQIVRVPPFARRVRAEGATGLGATIRVSYRDSFDLAVLAVQPVDWFTSAPFARDIAEPWIVGLQLDLPGGGAWPLEPVLVFDLAL